MRAGVGEQKVLFQIKFRCICSKMIGLMKMSCLTIVPREPVSPCIAMEEGGPATAQFFNRKQVSNTEI